MTLKNSSALIIKVQSILLTSIEGLFVVVILGNFNTLDIKLTLWSFFYTYTLHGKVFPKFHFSSPKFWITFLLLLIMGKSECIEDIIKKISWFHCQTLVNEIKYVVELEC